MCLNLTQITVDASSRSCGQRILSPRRDHGMERERRGKLFVITMSVSSVFSFSSKPDCFGFSGRKGKWLPSSCTISQYNILIEV